MCTVVFIPGKERQLLASLRDEQPVRAATKPALYACADIQFLAPADVLGGTWIGVNNYGHAIILLNGAFERHVRQPSYRLSRGAVVRELLCSAYPVLSWTVMDLEGIEPFTLIVYSEQLLFRLTWDGAQKYKLLLDAQQPHIFSSATLYDRTAREKREQLFSRWIASGLWHDQASLSAFFNSYTDPENGFYMNRAGHIRTIAASFLQLEPRSAVFTYMDILTRETAVQSLRLQQCEQCFTDQ